MVVMMIGPGVLRLRHRPARPPDARPRHGELGPPDAPPEPRAHWAAHARSGPHADRLLALGALSGSPRAAGFAARPGPPRPRLPAVGAGPLESGTVDRAAQPGSSRPALAGARLPAPGLAPRGA